MSKPDGLLTLNLQHAQAIVKELSEAFSCIEQQLIEQMEHGRIAKDGYEGPAMQKRWFGKCSNLTPIHKNVTLKVNGTEPTAEAAPQAGTGPAITSD